MQLFIEGRIFDNFANVFSTGFQVDQKVIATHETIICRFYHDPFAIEAFAQERAVKEQEAWKHMMVQYEILRTKGEEFKRQVIDLKNNGFKPKLLLRIYWDYTEIQTMRSLNISYHENKAGTKLFITFALNMRAIATIFVTLFLATVANAQSQGDILIGIHLDLIKSDYDDYFQKAQAGIEGHYFFSEKFAVTGGIEVWTREGTSAVAGIRWYPIRDAYIRARALLGENDLSLGGGWAKPITEELRFETMADFYFEGNFAIRAGFAFLIRKTE